MNSKQAKRLRRSTQKAIDIALRSGVQSSPSDDTHIRKRSYERFLVPSLRNNVTVTSTDGTVTKHKDTAVQVRLTTGSPRQVYRQVKQRVQANRGKKRRRVLSGVQLRPAEAPGAVEHAGAAGVQPEYLSVPGLQGMGIQDHKAGA